MRNSYIKIHWTFSLNKNEQFLFLLDSIFKNRNSKVQGWDFLKIFLSFSVSLRVLFL